MLQKIKNWSDALVSKLKKEPKPTSGINLLAPQITSVEETELKTTSVSTSPVSLQTPASTSNVFTDLFPKEKKTENDTVIKSLNATVSGGTILKQKLNDSDILIYKKPNLGGKLVLLSTLLIILSSLFFYFRLSETFSWFGENPVQKNASAKNELIVTAGKFQARNTMLAKYALDDFLFTADNYFYKNKLYKSPLTSQKKKTEIDSEFPTLRSRMREDLLLAREKLSASALPPSISALTVSKDEIKKSARESLRSEIANSPDKTEFIRACIKLLDAVLVVQGLESKNIPSMTDDQFKEIVDILSTTNSSSFGTLTSIRDARIHWNDVINEIEKVTKTVDKLFATKILDQKVGEIFYTSYNFDSSNHSISITGETISDDGSNFTISADLIDALNASPMFENADMTTYTKSMDAESTYKGVLNIDLILTTKK